MKDIDKAPEILTAEIQYLIQQCGEGARIITHILQHERYRQLPILINREILQIDRKESRYKR